MVSSNAPRRGASPPRPLRHPDRSAPRLGSRFAVSDQDTCVKLSFIASAKDTVGVVRRAQIRSELRIFGLCCGLCGACIFSRVLGLQRDLVGAIAARTSSFSRSFALVPRAAQLSVAGALIACASRRGD
jgi:hypothetical protein